MYTWLLIAVLSRELLHVVQVSRHGARSPLTWLPWDTKQRWPQGKGVLTTAGMRQHFLIGTELRNRYIVQQKFLSEHYNSSEIRVRSTDTERTLVSALSQLQGLYPPGTGPDLRSALLQDKSVPPINIFDKQQIINSLGLKSLPSNTQMIPIHSELQDLDLQLASSHSCARYQQERKKNTLLSNKKFSNLLEQYQGTIQFVIDFVREKYGIDMIFQQGVSYTKHMYGSIKCNQYNDYQIPSQINQTMIDYIVEYDLAYKQIQSYQGDFVARLSGSDFLRELSSIFQSVLNDGNYTTKFNFFSAHDSTLMSIMAALDLPVVQPPFASTMIFQLFKDGDETFVDLLYNDDSLQLKNCSSSICSYQEFSQILENRMLDKDICEPEIVDAGDLVPAFSQSFDYADGDSGNAKWYFWLILVLLVVVIGCFVAWIVIKKRRSRGLKNLKDEITVV